MMRPDLDFLLLSPHNQSEALRMLEPGQRQRMLQLLRRRSPAQEASLRRQLGERRLPD
jgi:hypothetical protein